MYQHAVVTCNCSKTSLTFHNPNPINRCECGCYSCRQKIQYCNKKSKRNIWIPTFVNLWYFENDIINVTGEEYLKLFMLRDPKGSSIVSPFVVATCCHTILCVPALYYREAFVAIYSEDSNLKCNEIPSLIRYSSAEYLKEFGHVPIYKGKGLDLQQHIFEYTRGNVGNAEEQKAAKDWTSRFNNINPPGKIGETIQSICKRLRIDQSVNVLGIEKIVLQKINNNNKFKL